MSEIEDRRQRAREVFYDSYAENGSGGAAELAIEAATQVKITDDILSAMTAESRKWFGEAHARHMIFIAGLKAAGFEVIE